MWRVACAVAACASRCGALRVAVSQRTRGCNLAATAETDAPAVAAIELSVAERARTAAELGVEFGASLSTTCRDESACAGAPWSSYVDYVLDKRGAPVILLREGAEHSLNLAERRTASLMLQARSARANGESYGAATPRLTIVGDLVPVSPDDEDAAALEASFAVAHTYSDDLLARSDDVFSLNRVLPTSVFYVGGFGVKSTWVALDAYTDAAADVVAKDAAELCEQLNGPRHAADLRIVAEQFLGLSDATEVSVASVDRLGVDFRVKRGAQLTEEYRVAYRVLPRSCEDAKSEVNKLLQEAWELDQGMEWDGAYDKLPTVKKYAASA